MEKSIDIPDRSGTAHLKLITLALALAVVISHSSAMAQEETALGDLRFSPGQFTHPSQLPASALRDRLEELEDPPLSNAIEQLNALSFSSADIDLFRLDDLGNVYVVDNFLPPPAPLTVSTGFVPAPTLEAAFSLHSKPGSKNTVYLDFNGHSFSAAWGSFVGVAYSLDQDHTTFNATERAQIVEIWHRVSDDFAQYDIDVTTEAPNSLNSRTGRILITEDIDANGKHMPACCSVGGVAYLNVFGRPDYPTRLSPALVYANKLSFGATYIAEASSHEFGHNLGLSHDGTTHGTPYFDGLGSGPSSWAPIMGNSYSRNVTQWSKGEYPNANQKQDDVAIIGEKLGMKADDHASVSPGSWLVVSPDGVVNSSNSESDPHNTRPSNKGVINSRSDEDVFSYLLRGGPVALQVKPAWAAFYRPDRRGANLDVRAELLDNAGKLIAGDDSTSETHASISAEVIPGLYHLRVSGVGNPITPYSDYGSEGRYFISGTLPAQPQLSDIKQIASSSTHTCALSNAGAVSCWGSNMSGELGVGPLVKERLTPGIVEGLDSGVIQISAGGRHACALLATGSVKCWGNNFWGQLGDGTKTVRPVPVQVIGLPGGVTAIEAGASHTCAITGTGTAVCWGNNDWGQLGDGTKVSKLAPTSVAALTNVVRLTAGYAHTCAINDSGGASCWGFNARGQIGDGTTTVRLAPVGVAGLSSGVTSISAGSMHTCAIAGGSAKCWGQGSRIGSGTETNSALPKQVVGIQEHATEINAGSGHTCAIVLGSVRCWGSNNSGQLGDGTWSKRLAPVETQKMDDVTVDLSGGGRHSCAVLAGGGVRCWGGNLNGQLGDFTTMNRPHPVSVWNRPDLPELYVRDLRFKEGHTGTRLVTFEVWMSGAAAWPVRFSATTKRWSHNHENVNDYEALASHEVIIPAGQALSSVRVQIHGDTAVENDEYFRLELDSPVGAVIADDAAVGVIENDDF